jgi:hypothetical protein
VSLKSGIFPEHLKVAIIRPIYKAGQHKQFENYRPIAILSIIDKILERFVADKLSKYLRENNIINAYQYAF